ncbi:MAG: hypothetical protein M3Y03_04560 [Verrucomicrobiota bacterium]|nr:hypothetical protein [Verrucomicrobiota bacterium]
MFFRAAVGLLAGLVFSFAAAIAAERAVVAHGGNIFLNESNGQSRQLTSSGRDSAPRLSPDGKWVVFVRTLFGKKISTGSDEVDAAELWQIQANGKQPTLLVRPRESEKPEELIAGFDNLQFSTDGRLVYFVTSAWATSGAVHVVDTTKAKERFVLPGNNLEVITIGKYRDCLLVQQHRYFLGAGSFDWFWLFRPDGTEVGPIGEETERFKELYGK